MSFCCAILIKKSKGDTMDVKKKVLECLESNKGCTFSGAKLADEIGVSRTAVWKAIKSLEQQGYSIDASTNKGYCLKENSDKLSAESIRPFLNEEYRNCDIQVFDSLDSTNNYAKKLAQEGAEDFTVVIAEEQTQGRGRLGRTFYSPHSKGIYMSVILRPKMSAKEALFITTSAAVAVSEAVEKVCNIDTQIKWVNDVYSNGRKMCGILTEASIDFETGGLEYAIVGIGINVSTASADLPDELSDVATSIFGDSKSHGVRSEIAANVINNLCGFSKNLGDKSILEEYKKRSFLLGKDIYVIRGDKRTLATAIDLDDNAELIVKYQDGATECLSSGEVSIRERK